MRLRRALLSVIFATASGVGLTASPAKAGPYCSDLDVVWCAVLHVVEKADCKVNGNCH